MSEKPKLTPTMQAALDFARAHDGKLTRHPGGFWCGPTRGGFSGRGISTAPSRWFGTPTVEALVARGLMTYTAHQERKSGGTFPVEASIVRVTAVESAEASARETDRG